jgi:drug/metabolite transporter (DMT)-like permease
MMGAVVCLLGVVLIAHPSWLFGNKHGDTGTDGTTEDAVKEKGNLAIAMALLGAAFAGMAYMSVRKIGHGASANVMVLY